MRIKFYENLLNSIDKVETVTLEEKNDKSALIVSVIDMIRSKGVSVTWNKKKWVIKEK